MTGVPCIRLAMVVSSVVAFVMRSIALYLLAVLSQAGVSDRTALDRPLPHEPSRSAVLPVPPLTPLRITLSAAETLHVETGGALRTETPVVVLISGPVGSAYSLRKITDALQLDGQSVLVVDPLGMGASSRPREADYSLTRQAERIRAVLDRLVLPRTPVVLAGPGTSASIALRLAAADTSRIRGVVSIAGGPVDHQGTSGIRVAMALAPLLNNAFGRAIGRRRFASGARDQSADPSWVTSAVVETYLAPFERDVRASFRALKAMGDASEATPIAAILPGVQAPVRLIVGDKPLPNAPSAAQITTLRQQLKTFRVDTIAHAGTMLHEEQATGVARIILDVVKATTGR